MQHATLTLQLCTSCWCDTVFLLEAAAFWAAAMVCVAAAAACLAAIYTRDANGKSFRPKWEREELGWESHSSIQRCITLICSVLRQREVMRHLVGEKWAMFLQLKKTKQMLFGLYSDWQWWKQRKRSPGWVDKTENRAEQHDIITPRGKLDWHDRCESQRRPML